MGAIRPLSPEPTLEGRKYGGLTTVFQLGFYPQLMMKALAELTSQSPMAKQREDKIYRQIFPRPGRRLLAFNRSECGWILPDVRWAVKTNP